MTKKTASSKTGRFAGDAVKAAALSPDEERLFAEIFATCRGVKEIGPGSPIGISEAAARRRENAVRSSLPFFYQQFEEKYNREETLTALLTAVAIPVRFTEYYLESKSLLLGTAVWILDYAERHDLRDELFALLPAEADAKTERRVAMAKDLIYPREQIVRLAHLLRTRKTSSQKEFRKLLALIRKTDAIQLRVLFRDTLTDYFERFLEVRARIKVAETSSSTDTPAPLPSSFPSPAPSPRPSLHPPIPSASVRTHPEPSVSPLSSNPLSILTSENGQQRIPLTQAALLKEARQYRPDLFFLLKTPTLTGASREKMQSELYYRRMTDLLSGFTIADPYALCAAFLLLEKENDLLMDMGTLTSSVILCTERCLPWSYEEADVWQTLTDEGHPDYTPRFLFQPPEPSGKKPDGGTAKRGREEWGAWEDGAGATIERGQLLSEVQLFYLATGYLLPRDRNGAERLVTWFQRQGLPENRAREYAFGAMLLSCLDGGQNREVWKRTEADASPAAPSQEEIQRLAEDEEKIAELTRQLKAARQSQHEAEQSARQLQEQMQAAEKRASRDHIELHNLRENLFRMKSGEENPEDLPVPKEVEFPWQVRRRVLVFGGHDTWSKSIRPLLPGARFFERESLVDLNAIKGADVVWIQANALSHKFYYRIIDTARKEEIPVQYFGYASARKCAQQLATYEMAVEEK